MIEEGEGRETCRADLKGMQAAAEVSTVKVWPSPGEESGL